MAAIPTPQGELEVGRRGYQPAATPFSVGKGGARQTPCRAPLSSPCPKLAPILLAAKRIMLRPAHHEIDIAAGDCEQPNLLQYGIGVLVHYRAAISPATSRVDGRTPC